MKRGELDGYKEFITEEEAQKWAEKNYAYQCSDEFKSGQDFDALFHYGGNNYKSVNRFLRNNEKISQETKLLVERLRKIVLSTTLTENVVVYRSVKYSCFKNLCGENKISRGVRFCDKAFLSTSLSKNCAMKFHKNKGNDCTLKLYLTAGIHAIYLSYTNTISVLHEQELLLEPEVEFEIIKVKGIRQKVIECKMV